MWQQMKNYYHLVQAIIANILYGFPSTKLKVIGVTGTDGKTTTTSLIYHILKENGKKVSMISTIFAEVGGKVYDTGFHVTTPSPFTVQKYLQQAIDHGDEYFVLETTSHALDQFRVFGIQYEVGVITNITHEHLLYHQTYENYVRAKTRLLEMSKVKIVNRDDGSYEHIVLLLPKSKLLSYGLKKEASYQLDISQKLGKELPDFNRYNYLAAYAVTQELGLSDEAVLNGIASFSTPAGRMETMYDKDFKVIIDFAHTPNAIFEALKAIRSLHKDRRIIHLFGSASERDDSKRPLMGEASGEYADLVIVTEEDHRQEDPVKIAKEIAVGLEKENVKFVENDEFGEENKTYTILPSRQKAVELAFKIIKPGDVLVLTGKGHEMSLNRYGKEHHWNDKEAVMKEIEKKILL